MDKDFILKNLDSIRKEIAYEEIDCNDSLLDVIEDVIYYLDNKEGFFDDEDISDKYETLDEFADAIKSCVDELRCDRYENDDVIKYLDLALEIILNDA